jgi:hypothetical protein
MIADAIAPHSQNTPANILDVSLAVAFSASAVSRAAWLIAVSSLAVSISGRVS